VIRKPSFEPENIPVFDSDGLKIIVDRQGQRVKTKAGSWRQVGSEADGYAPLTRLQTPEEYGSTLRDRITDNPQYFFARRIIPRTEIELREATKDRLAVALQIEQSIKSDSWPRSANACFDFGNQCDYFDICTGAGSFDDSFEKQNTQHSELSNVKHRLPLVTNSSIGTYQTCQRKYYYAYHIGIRKRAVSDALRFGTMMHSALEIWWSSLDIEKCLTVFDAEENPYTRQAARELMIAYDILYRDVDYESVAVEHEFAVPIKGSNAFLLGGKIDAIARKEE
jgi:CRISPR/Cas system-associated exonuclease Cas4 (RecB family)